MRSLRLFRRAANRLVGLVRLVGLARLVRSLTLRAAAGSLSIILLATPGCGSVFKDVNAFSEADEIALGREFSREIERELKLYRDPEVVRYVDELCQALALHSKRSNIPYYIKVVDTDEVNAFALPGGYLYINRGLISISGTEAELAGVIAHEIAHVVARHGAKALLSMLHHSREAEREADALAVVNLREAGYDPEGLTGFFEKLLEINDRDPGAFATLFTTHPPSRERIENTREQAAELPVLEGLITDSERFRQIKDMLPPLKKNPLEKEKAE